MKVDTFYFNDISDYDDIIEYISNNIDAKYYGIGKNSISISKFVNYLKVVIKSYIRIKYKKNVNVILTLQREDEKLVNNYNETNGNIRIRLSNEKIGNILDGNYPRFVEYLNELFDQLETELTCENKFNFNDYLNVQLTTLTELAFQELKAGFTISYLKRNVLKKESWIKLAQKSSIFNDYYIAYMEQRIPKSLFYLFIKTINDML